MATAQNWRGLNLKASGASILAAMALGIFLLPLRLRSQEAASETQETSPALTNRIDPKSWKILQKVIAVLGGDTFLNAKSLRTEGRIFGISEGSTSGLAPFESLVEFPSKRRFSYGKNKPVILINDGERGWQMDRYGMIRQPPKQVRVWGLLSRYTLNSLLRYVIHEEGLLIQSAGTEFVGPVSTVAVNITDAQQVRTKLNIDAKKFLPIRVAFRVQDPKTREWEEYAEVLGDYKEIQGIQTPMQITLSVDGERVNETFRKNVEYNVEIPPNSFRPGS